MTRTIVTCDYCDADISEWQGTSFPTTRLKLVRESRDENCIRVTEKTLHFCDSRCLAAHVKKTILDAGDQG